MYILSYTSGTTGDAKGVKISYNMILRNVNSSNTPERFVLQIFWDTLEDHTVGFRQSTLFTEWRAIVGPFFAAPPHVEHFELSYTSA